MWKKILLNRCFSTQWVSRPIINGPAPLQVDTAEGVLFFRKIQDQLLTQQNSEALLMPNTMLCSYFGLTGELLLCVGNIV